MSETTGQNKGKEQRFAGFLQAKNGSRSIVVGTVTRQRAGQPGVRFPKESRKFSSTMSRTGLVPTQIFYSMGRGGDPSRC